MKKFILIILAIFFLPGLASSTEPTLPGMISIVSLPSGTGGYILAGGVREVVERQTPMKVRVTPFGTDLARAKALKDKKGEIGFVAMGPATIWAYGLFDFAAPDLGPQSVQIIYIGEDFVITLASKGQKCIRTFADLRGKRVGFVPGYPTVNKTVEAMLAYGNLKWEDVKKVPFPSLPATYRGLQSNSCDVALSFSTSSGIHEIAAAPGGICHFPLPVENKEGWKRLRKIAPWVSPILAPLDPKAGINKEFTAGSYPYGLIAYDFVSGDVVYQVVKAMHLDYENFKKMWPSAKEYTIEKTLKMETLPPVPFHPGAVKYFKEMKKWTSEHEQWQKEQLQAQKERLSTFTRNPKAWQEKYGGEEK